MTEWVVDLGPLHDSFLAYGVDGITAPRMLTQVVWISLRELSAPGRIPEPELPTASDSRAGKGGLIIAVRSRSFRFDVSDGTSLLVLVLVAGDSLVLLFGLLPTGVELAFLHRRGESIGLLAEILLIHNSILRDHECHHAR